MNAQSTTLAPPSPATLNLDETAAIEALCVQLRYSPQAPASLYIDCKQLRCQRTLGVSYVISQLLRLRQAGASIWLRNVNAPLRRCLQLLQLASLFHFVDSE
jgi:anti-anti-sigma regulatory factor